MEQHVDLDIIGVIEGTERASSVRPAYDQLRHYEVLLAPLRRAPLTLIDLAPGDGALTVWNWFLSAATIIAVHPEAATGTPTPAAARIHHRAGKRTDRAFLTALCAEHAPSIIVDGAATAADSFAVFEHLFPLLPQGGLYLLPGLGAPGTPPEAMRAFLDLARACAVARPAGKAHAADMSRLADSVTFAGGGLMIRRRNDTRDLTRALSTADAYLAAQRRDSGALERLAAYIVRHNGPLARAEAAIEAALEEDGETLPRLLLRAEIMVAQKRGEESEAAVARAAAAADKKPAQLHRLARLYATLGNGAAALECAEAAVAGEPGNAAFQRTLGAVRGRMDGK